MTISKMKKTVYYFNFTDEELNAMETTCRVLYAISDSMPLDGVIVNKNTGKTKSVNPGREAIDLLTALADRCNPNWYTLDDVEDSGD